MDETVTSHRNQDESFLPRSINANCYEAEPTSYRPCGNSPPTGWHTFRHTFRSLLDETGAPLKVQQELMRHADIRTTMNIYGKAMERSKREAHGKVVRLVLASQVA